MSDEPRPASNPQPQQRAVGSPLPRGSSRPQAPSAEGAVPRSPGANLANAQAPSQPGSRFSGVMRAVGAVRAALPLVQRVLPMLEGNFATAVSNVLAPIPKPAPPVDLGPIAEGIAELQLQQLELRDQVAEQHTTLKRVEDQLQGVREATDRNTLEQQELMQDLKSVGTKVNVVAVIALILLLTSVALNVFLFLRIENIVR